MARKKKIEQNEQDANADIFDFGDFGGEWGDADFDPKLYDFLEESPELYQFYEERFDAIINKYKTINKACSKSELWDVLRNKQFKD